MMRVAIAVLGLALFAQASMLDFYRLSEAKKAYEAKDFNRSAKLYEEVGRQGNPQALFDAADAWFEAGNYKKALELYRKVDDPKLAHAKWHNIGNAYAHLGRIDEAIDAYKKALKIQEDEETRYNLELMEKLKKERQKKKQQNKNQNQQQNQKRSDQQKKPSEQKQNQNNKKQNQKGEKGSKSQQKSQNRKSREKEGSKNEKGEKEKMRQRKEKSGKGEKGEKRNEPRRMKPETAKPQKNVPISDMELRKWNKILNQRGINTLMLPLPTKENRQRNPDETNPW